MSQDESNLAPRFLQLAIVNILSNLLVPIAGLLDMAFLGHLSDIRHLAGVALATVIFNYLYWSFGFLRMGTTGMTAQAIGRNDQAAVRMIALRNGMIAIAIGVLILIFQTPIQAIGFAILSATPEVKASGQEFYRALIWGAPATLLNFVLIGWFLGRSQSGKVLLLSAVSNVANVSLDYLFVVKWGWASIGAGASTALAQYLMLIVGLFMVRDGFGNVDVVQLCDRTELKAIFALNRDLLIRTLALISTFAVFTNLSSTLGTTVLAANTLLLQAVTFSAYFIDGFAFATETLAGTYYESRSQLVRLLKIAGIYCISVGIIFAIGFITFPTFLFRLLTNHQTILIEIQPFTGWLLPILGFGAIAYLLDGYFLGLTAGKILRISSLWATFVGFLPIAILATFLRSTSLLWLALSIFMLVRAITLGIQVPSTLKGKALEEFKQ
ncbi:MAG: MATE family efflux transporter [Leptolyngbya sp. Prado105]|jgi:MATE family multidrug resistance protein|nr:MATE family efflux transporter [Leptolyngbya sp. Prado105]